MNNMKWPGLRAGLSLSLLLSVCCVAVNRPEHSEIPASVEYVPVDDLGPQPGLWQVRAEDTCDLRFSLTRGPDRIELQTGLTGLSANGRDVVMAAPTIREAGVLLVPVSARRLIEQELGQPAPGEAPKLDPIVTPPPPAPSLPAVGPGPWDPPARVRPRAWQYVVIHHSATTAGDAASFDRYHREERGWEHGLGYHFVIGNGHGARDGQLEVGPRWLAQLQGAHAGAGIYNEAGIGICLVGDFDRRAPTAAQLATLRSLVAGLCGRFRIPSGRVLGHREVKRTASGSPATQCPGRNFSLDEIRRGLK